MAAGGDNVRDPFCPVNRGDPRETARLLVLATHRPVEEAFGMVSGQAWQVLGGAPVEARAGADAAFMLVDAPSITAFVAGEGGVLRWLA